MNLCKLTTENLPKNFYGYFKEMRNQHNYNTRGSKEEVTFKITQEATTYGVNSLHHRAANDWNESLKNGGLESDKYFSLNLKFTKALKAYLLSKYI